MPATAIAYIADKLTGGVVSYAVRLGADATLNKLKQHLAEKNKQDALKTVIARALTLFEEKYPQLAQSLFDSTFIESRGMEEISKFIALSIRDEPDARSLAGAFGEYFRTPVPQIEEACAHFLLLFREEIEASPEFVDVMTQRIVRDTGRRVRDLQPAVDELLEHVKQLQTALAEGREPVFEARVETFVNNGICDEDRIVIRNVGAPLSQLKVSQLFVLVARLYDMRSVHKSVVTRTNGYYPGGAVSTKATGEVYSTLKSEHRMKMMRLIDHTRIAMPGGHLALVDFDRYLALSFRDQKNAARASHMKISEFGYEEVPAADYDKVRADAGGELFDYYSKSQEDYVALLRQALVGYT